MFDFFRFYNKPQNYKAEICVNVENRSSVPKKGILVVPVPVCTEYQMISPKFEKPTVDFDFDVLPDEKKVFSVAFSVSVFPRRYEGVIAPEIKQANEFVISYLTYGNPIKGLYTAQEAREKRVVDCGGFDALLQDELKKKGIGSKIIAGFWNDGKMHAWLEIENNIPADPSVEHLKKQGRTKKSGRLGFVGSDRIAFSVGLPAGQAGEPFLQNPFLLSGFTAQLHYENNFYCARA